MGLDTSRDRTLWRDRALLELNVAVLHSYEKAGVTMMDHHASGRAVTLYHKDHWQDIELTPAYRAQPDAWKEDDGWRH